MSKTAIICAGGLMRGAFTAGALKFLSENRVSYDLHYGVSAGACCLAYFISNQMNLGLEIWTRDLAYGKLINKLPLFKPIIDLDYLHKVFSEICPLKRDIFYAKNLYVVLTDTQTNLPSYFRAAPSDVLTLLRGSSSVKYLSNGSVNYWGRKFIDGGYSDPLPVLKAIRDGATDITIILTKPIGNSRRSFFKVKKLYEESLQIALKTKSVKITIIAPPINLGSKINDSPEHILDLINAGYLTASATFL